MKKFKVSGTWRTGTPQRLRPKGRDIELVRYLANLPISEIVIGGTLRQVVHPDYLLADDRDRITQMLASAHTPQDRP